MRLMPFNAWTEIDDLFEGRFMERFAPGSLLRTMVEDRDEIRSLFQHGRDPSIGAKPLGPILTLEERADGAYAEVPLLDASYVADLVPGIDAGLYGVSIRFSVVREEFRRRPTPSDYNPEGIPERTVTEARLYEFGPVTFPAYKTTQANLG